MNLCILLGKIVSDIEFKFIIKGENKSIAYFYLLLLNQSIVRINVYNEMADYIYRKLKNGQIVIVEGELRQAGSVECESFKLVNKIGKKYKQIN